MSDDRKYRFGDSELTLRFGDITTSDAQVIVSSDDVYLSMGGGVSAAIRAAGGNAIALDAAKKVPAELGDVVVTTAGSLHAQYVFHAITVGARPAGVAAEAVVEQTTRRCMQLLDTLSLGSIAFPTIGSGNAGFRYAQVAAQMAAVIAGDLNKRKRPVEVTIYLFDRTRTLDYIAFFEEFARLLPTMPAHQVTPQVAVAEPVFKPEDALRTVEEINAQRLLNLRKVLVSLEDQRSKLEERLVECVTAGKTGDVRDVRLKLSENQELRLSYMGELNALRGDIATQSHDAGSGPPGLSAKPKSVFVSSTYSDLIEYRNAVKDQITKRDMFFRGMEFFGADSENRAPAAKIVEEVRNADVYLGIFGVRYGYVDQATGLSMTELEFNAAETSGKPMLLYVIRDDAPIKVSDVEPDPASKAKLDALKAKIRLEHVVGLFSSVAGLAGEVYADLGKLTG